MTTQTSVIQGVLCSLDKLLEGGIYSGEVTELCGAPGVGKTQVSQKL